MIIEDGKGNGRKAQVNLENQIVTRAITESEIEHASASGGAYVWDSTEKDINAGDTMLFVQNTSETPLVLDLATVNGSNVICTWTIHTGADITTPSGTTVSGVNMNPKFRSVPADAIGYADETAVADGDIVGRIKTAISETKPINLNGFILERNHYVQFTQVTESTSGSVILRAHYANPS